MEAANAPMGKYFTLAELTASATAKSRGIDNTPPPAVKVKLDTLIIRCLDPIRAAWGKPLRVTSGFRSPVLNKAVGGAATSQHTKGEAADLSAGSREDNLRLFEMIRKNHDYDQIIDENDGAWVHVSYKAGVNRREALRLRNGKYVKA